MPRKKKIPDPLKSLLSMAKEYGVSDNAMFIQAANQYALQLRVIDSIKEYLDDKETLVATKEYVKGRENIYANPLVKELPKHADSANKTAMVILNIIKQFASVQTPKLEDLLSKFQEEE